MTKFTFATSKEGFDNHIDTSVRGYSQLWGDILSLSKYFVEDYTQVVDMGCSSGKLLKGMVLISTNESPKTPTPFIVNDLKK